MSVGFTLGRTSLLLATAAVLLTGCTSSDSGRDVDSDCAQNSSELRETVTEIAAGCEEAGGPGSGCECLAEWLVQNTSVGEMSFGENPPSTGTWIYVGGNLYIPGQYEDALRKCMQ